MSISYVQRIARSILAVALAWIALAAFALGGLPRVAARPLAGTIPCSGSIQSCIDAAQDGDTIVVAAGTYTESLTLGKPVSLTGAGSASTVIWALSGQRVLTVTGDAISNTVIISGLTFAGGDVSNGFLYPDNCGGGILISDTAQPLIQNVVITASQAYRGGGLCTASALNLIGTRLFSNTAVNAGGGIYALNAVIALSGGSLERNSCPANGCAGAGLYADGLIADGARFIGNIGEANGGGAQVLEATLVGAYFEGNRCTHSSCYGGGIAAIALNLSGTQFINNRAKSGGAGAYASDTASIFGGRFESNRLTRSTGMGGGLNAGSLILTGTVFVKNSAGAGPGVGGGLYALTATLTGGQFQINNGYAGGGGLYVSGALTVNNSLFFDNTASDGGGLYAGVSDGRIVNSLFGGNTAITNGAAIFVNATGNLDILHTTIADVAANTQPAVFIAGGTVGITDSIVTQHAAGLKRVGGTLYEDYNLYFGNTQNFSGAVVSGGHSRIDNPAFFNAAAGNYHLSLASPAIDAGVDAGVNVDVDGDSRPLGAGFDIGYDEWIPVPVHRTYVPNLLR